MFSDKRITAIFTPFAQPAEIAAALEREGPLPPGPDERYSGYAVLGVGFTSGDVLALRRFPVTSRGPAYTSVWHRAPDGRWTLFTDVPNEGCARHFGPALDAIVVAPIRIEWTDSCRMAIAVDGGRRLTWSLTMRATALTRAFNRFGPSVQPLLERHPGLLTVLATAARVAFWTGPLRLRGLTPSGAAFAGRPWALWTVGGSWACIDGRETGPSRVLREPLALGDFPIPKRGLFAVSHAVIRPPSG